MNVMKFLGGIGNAALEGAVDLTAMTVMHSLCPVSGAINVEKAILTLGKMGISHAVSKQVSRQIRHELKPLTQVPVQMAEGMAEVIVGETRDEK